MDDFRDLDLMLDDLPIPEEALSAVTPWRQALRNILWGLALNTITINHWNLDHFLPLLGTALLFLGWGSLRREGTWTRLGWLSAGVLTALRVVNLALMATPLTEKWDHWWVVSLPLTALMALQYLCLWRGLKEVFRRADQEPRTGAPFGLFLWYLLLIVSAWLLAGAGGLLYGLMVLAYPILIYNLWRVARVLEEAGYVLEPTPAPISYKKFLLILTLVVALVLGGELWAFARYPVSLGRPVEGTAQELRAHLAQLGYPEELLADLSLEDLDRCQDAVGINQGYAGDEGDDLDLRTIEVILSDGSCRYFAHFRWLEEPRYRGMEHLRVYPCIHKYLEELAGNWGEVTGRLLYDLDGTTWEREFHSLESTYVPREEEGMDRIEARFSFPKEGENLRGYVAFDQGSREVIHLNYNMLVEYTRSTALRFPWMSPGRAQRGWFSGDWGFEFHEELEMFSLYDSSDPIWVEILEKG